MYTQVCHTQAINNAGVGVTRLSAQKIDMIISNLEALDDLGTGEWTQLCI